MIFNNMEALRQQYPGPGAIIDQENEFQYPQAKFIIAGLDGDDLMAFFDVGTPSEVLWVLVSGSLEDPIPNQGAYIDEYYEIPVQEAKDFYGAIFNERTI